jgi:hypothetical protein
MIHYSCDRCRKTIDPSDEIRYVVKLEVHVALDPLEGEEETSDRDYLEEIQENLEKAAFHQLEDDDCDLTARHASGTGTYDLCPACFRKFSQNPVGSDLHAPIGFSSN